jgi:hypothetical protein
LKKPLDFLLFCIIILKIVAHPRREDESNGRNNEIWGLHGEKSFNKL